MLCRADPAGSAQNHVQEGKSLEPGQRSTGNRVFAVMAGSGRSEIGDQLFHWAKGDTFVAPCWHWFSHHAEADAQIFTCTDEPILRFAKYLYQDDGFEK